MPYVKTSVFTISYHYIKYKHLSSESANMRVKYIIYYNNDDNQIGSNENFTLVWIQKLHPVHKMHDNIDDDRISNNKNLYFFINPKTLLSFSLYIIYKFKHFSTLNDWLLFVICPVTNISWQLSNLIISFYLNLFMFFKYFNIKKKKSSFIFTNLYQFQIISFHK